MMMSTTAVMPPWSAKLAALEEQRRTRNTAVATIEDSSRLVSFELYMYQRLCMMCARLVDALQAGRCWRPLC